MKCIAWAVILFPIAESVSASILLHEILTFLIGVTYVLFISHVKRKQTYWLGQETAILFLPIINFLDVKKSVRVVEPRLVLHTIVLLEKHLVHQKKSGGTSS